MTDPPQRDVLSWFWAPLCAIGCSGERGPNAQICVSVFGASIVPDRPRLLVVLSNTNYTTDLVRTKGSLSVTVLSEAQIGLLEPLGLRSGRQHEKLAGLAMRFDGRGNPVFEGGSGFAGCAVLGSYDFGDSTAFLCGVRERETWGAAPMTWQSARDIVGDEFLRRWQEKSLREQEAARATMLWREAKG